MLKGYNWKVDTLSKHKENEMSHLDDPAVDTVPHASEMQDLQGQQEGIPSLYEYLKEQEPHGDLHILEDPDLRAETD